MSIRRATAADLESLVALATAFRIQLEEPSPSEAEFRASFAALLRETSVEFFLAWSAGGDPVGYVQLRYQYSAWPGGLLAELDTVFVVANARRSGVGRRLVELAIERAAACGCRAIGLNTNERNQAAVALYRELGFRSGRQHWQGGQQLWFERALDSHTPPADRASLDAYFDYISPFAYMASEVLDALTWRHHVPLSWKPIELLRLSNFDNGLPYSDAKRAYVMIDSLRAAEYHGVPIAMPNPFPVQSRLALCLAIVALPDPRFPSLHRAIFRAAWRDRRDISSESVLADCIAAVDGDVHGWLRQAGSSETERQLDERTAAAEQMGLFGVPTFALGGELFWGVDSLPTLEWRLQQLGTV